MSGILERYPVLARLPEELRAGYAEKSDKGLPLTADECAALGCARCDSMVLIPVCGPTPDLRAIFGGDVEGGMREILLTAKTPREKERESA